MSSFDLLQEIRELLKGNVEKNQSRSIAIFAAALEATLAGIESTVDIVEVTTDYTASSRNSCILADASSGDVNVYLPKAEDFINYAAGTTKLLYVKKADAGGNSVIIHADAVDTIEGSPTYALTSPLEAITLASDGNDWFIIATNGSGGGGGGSGDVVGPASATDNAIVRFNLTSGKLVQNSLVTITDLGSIALPVGETVDGRDVSVDGAKLDTIETNADVTDATNVAAAGAVMESDYTPAHSLLVQQSGTGSPSSLSVGNNTLLGRASGGGSPIAALSATSVKTILDYQGSEVDFTPDGDIAATDVQAAIVEVRNDTDTKLGAKVDLAGQLGGTAGSPDVRGLRETSGPTLLTMGAVADGQLLSRSGTSIVGTTVSGGSPYRLFIDDWIPTRYYVLGSDEHPNGLAIVAGFADRIDLHPFIPKSNLTIDQIGVYVTTGVVSAEIKILVYSANVTTGVPDTLTYNSGALSVATTNSYAVATTGLPSFTAGTLYWLGCVHSSTASIRAIPLGSTLAFGGLGTANSGATQGSVIRRTIAGNFTTPPATWTFTATEITNGNTPCAIIARAA